MREQQRPAASRSRWIVPVATMVAVLISGLALHRFWLRELSNFTGPAAWVWITDRLDEVHPTAGLFISTLWLDSPPGEAVLKVCGDRDYVVYVNGTPAACGWSRPGFRLGLFDIGHLLRQGENVLGFEVRSPTPVGGLLFSLDVEGSGNNFLVSGPRVVLRRQFSLEPPRADEATVPVIWGIPPRFPWGYPRPVSHPRTLDAVVVDEPVRITASQAVSQGDGGWEYRLPERVNGYLWLEFDRDGAADVLAICAESGEAAGRPMEVIRLAGQRRWVDPQPHAITSVIIRGDCLPVAVEVFPVASEFFERAPGFVAGNDGRRIGPGVLSRN